MIPFQKEFSAGCFNSTINFDKEKYGIKKKLTWPARCVRKTFIAECFSEKRRAERRNKFTQQKPRKNFCSK